MKRPVLLHVMTKKGKGYMPAEEHPKLFHGVGKFDPATGNVPAKGGKSFSDAFGEGLCKLAAEDSRVCAITAAMPGGTGLLDFKKEYSRRMFDVGIAEEHAVSMAAGLAKQGMVPVVAIYSTFLQRAYDMILQDICLQGLHVVLAVDRAGLVGEDGETHHGVFDVGFLRQAPGMTILCPACTEELQSMLRWAVLEHDGPVAIRYPRGADRQFQKNGWNPDSPVITQRSGKDVAIVTYGTLINNALEAAEKLSAKGIDTRVIRLTSVAPLSVEQLRRELAGIKHALILEETIACAGIHEAIAWNVPDCNFTSVDLQHKYTTHGAINLLYQAHGMDADSIVAHIEEVCSVESKEKA